MELTPFQLSECKNLGFDPVLELTQAINYHHLIHKTCKCSWCQDKPKTQEKIYHLTLTLDPTHGLTHEDLEKYYQTFVKRKYMVIKASCLEHMSTNAHLHILFEYTNPKNWFKTAWLNSYKKKYGNFMLQKITVDNGLIDYIHKEEEDKKILL